MLELPIEIWTQIHALATSTGDGSVGRALSLVSTTWRTISAPFKLQSIALVGAKPILRFLCLLESSPENLRPEVRCLFIGCQNPRLYDSSTYHLDLNYERARGFAFTADLFPEPGTSPSLRISPNLIEQSVLRILENVAPTLRTLHTHLTFLTRASPLYSIPFPLLENLVIHGPFRTPPASSASVNPKLRCLRLASPSRVSPHSGAALLATLAIAAPNLCYLRIPHTACKTADLERALVFLKMRHLSRLIVEVGAVGRSSSPPHPSHVAEQLEHTTLMQLVQTDGRIHVIAESRRWLNVQAALLEWEECPELQWEYEDEVTSEV
ncbi:hypothetical protein C8J57DRAFT_1270220 [Mycena rebaudengoi]|nr:hypothetical protein C8J57DRAFT_1270220 [Mycena rebaudengoi]